MREALVTIGNGDFAELGIDDLVGLYQAAGIRDFEELACYGNSSVVQVEVEKRVDAEHLESLEYVEDWEHVMTTEDTHLYVVAFYAPALSDAIAEQAADLIGTCEPVMTEQGASLSLVGPQEAIAGTLSEYEQEGASPDLRKLGEYEGRRRPFDDLTERQREVIQTAYEMGYYEVPKEVSSEDIAAELAIDPSTVAEHLQRAERNLLAHHLSD